MTSLPDLPKLPKTPKGAGKPGKLPKLAKMPAKPSDPVPDPLADVEYTDNLEVDSARELSALEEGFRARAKNEEKRFFAATDSEFWLAVCFQDRDEKERFLAALGAADRAKTVGGRYISGRDLAALLDFDY